MPGVEFFYSWHQLMEVEMPAHLTITQADICAYMGLLPLPEMQMHRKVCRRFHRLHPLGAAYARLGYRVTITGTSVLFLDYTGSYGGCLQASLGVALWRFNTNLQHGPQSDGRLFCAEMSMRPMTILNAPMPQDAY